MVFAKFGNRWTESKIGHPKTITDEVKIAIIQFVAKDCETSLFSNPQLFQSILVQCNKHKLYYLLSIFLMHC